MNSGVCATKRGSMKAVVLVATPCAKALRFLYLHSTQQRLPGTERNKPHVMPPTLLVECLGALRSVPTRVRRNTAARARGRTLGLQLNAGVGPTADCADGLSPQGG